MQIAHETEGTLLATGERVEYAYFATVAMATIKVPTVIVGSLAGELATGTLCGKTADGFAIVLVDGEREEWPAEFVRR